MPWITVVDNNPGTGSQTLDVVITANPGASRSGTLTVAGMAFPITQDGGSSCNLTVTPPSVSEPVAGGHGTVAVGGSGCGSSFYVESYASWITLDNNSQLISQPGTVGFTVTANPGGQRSGYIVVNNTPVQITQAGNSCYYTVSPTSALIGEAGGTGSFTLTSTPSSCLYTATSSDTTAVTVTSRRFRHWE